jgi:hypothetical protein
MPLLLLVRSSFGPLDLTMIHYPLYRARRWPTSCNHRSIPPSMAIACPDRRARSSGAAASDPVAAWLGLQQRARASQPS